MSEPSVIKKRKVTHPSYKRKDREENTELVQHSVYRGSTHRWNVFLLHLPAGRKGRFRLLPVDIPASKGWGRRSPLSVSIFEVPTLQNSKQICPEMKLRGLVPNSYIHVSVSDLYIPTISLPIIMQENRWGGQIVEIYISLTDTWMLKLELNQLSFFSGNTVIEFAL